MKNKITTQRKLLSCILAAFFVLTYVPSIDVQAAADDYYASGQIAVTEPNTPGEDSAYVIFSKETQMSGMRYLEPNGAARNDELYSEQTVFNGVDCRQVYKENYLYLDLNDDFADENDRVFSLTFDYWDYGGGGYFYIEYLPRGEIEHKSIQVLKLGLDENGVKTAGTWFRVTVYVDDACFTGQMAHGTDFRIRSGAYNAFSKIEVRNLSRNVGEDENLGVYNANKANSLHQLGMFDGFGEGEAFEPCLEKELTREEALVQMIKSYNLTEEAISKNLKSSFEDVSEEAAPYIGLAEALGVIEKGTKLGAKEKFSQQELLVWYLRLLGADESEWKDNPYEAAWEYGLLNPSCMIFQPEKNADVDAFVVLAVNIFAMENKKTGYNPFTSLFEQGVYTTQTIADVNDDGIWNWLLQNQFTVPRKTVVDEYSGRTYHKLSFLGQAAIKDYYTQNCMSMDMKKLYFRTADLKLYEYDMETEQCRYIGDLMREWNQMVTPQNNLWYLNKKGQIMKVDLTTYEQTVMGELPEWQKRAAPTMLQVNNDESKVSFQWTDNSGEIDTNNFARIPVFDLKTKEWDLSHVWGFKTSWFTPNHQCINPNPKYSNYVFFAHEGYSTDARTGAQTPQYDRVWMVDTDSDSYYNAFVQKWFVQPKDGDVTTGFTGEGSVHEAWTNDGEWLLAVKNRNSRDGLERQIGPGRAVMMRPDGSEKRYIPADYSFTHENGHSGAGIVHCMASNDNRWLVADSTYSSSNKWSDLYLIDTYSGATYFLARLPETSLDPGHIHPQFSPDDQKVIFGLWSEDLTHAQIGWMDVSDIVNNPPEGGQYDISDSCKTFGYKGFDHYVTPVYNASGKQSGIKIPGGNQMYVDVKADVIESDNTPAVVSITYKDDSTLPIKFAYYTWNVNGNDDSNRLAEHVKYISRNGTGRTITKTFELDDICLGNMEILGSDFRIGAVGADATIISVDVSVSDKEE